MKPRSGKVRPGQTSPGRSKPWGQQLNWGPTGVASLILHHGKHAAEWVWYQQGIGLFLAVSKARYGYLGGLVRRDRDGGLLPRLPYRTMEVGVTPPQDAGEGTKYLSLHYRESIHSRDRRCLSLPESSTLLIGKLVDT